MKAQVSNIQRYSVNDGYGIRTIVFLTGCSMRCAWCQNPETLRGKPALMFTRENCAACGACRAVCPAGAACAADGSIGVDREKCISCLACAKVCYFNARKPSSREMDVDGVFGEVMKDESFFRNSGGGLTLSGGEPLLQPEFCRELLRRVGERDIHTAIETGGNVPYAAFLRVLPYTDLFLFDLKLLDERKHRRWTGAPNRTLLNNLERLARAGAEIIVRVPLLAGINDGAEFDAIADRVSGETGVRELHILPYHDLGAGKYEQLGMAYALANQKENDDREIQRCRRYAEGKGLRVSVGGAGFRHGDAGQAADANDATSSAISSRSSLRGAKRRGNPDGRMDCRGASRLAMTARVVTIHPQAVGF
jgi:pyruvate formate lyase activating enzyme